MENGWEELRDTEDTIGRYYIPLIGVPEGRDGGGGG